MQPFPFIGGRGKPYLKLIYVTKQNVLSKHACCSSFLETKPKSRRSFLAALNLWHGAVREKGPSGGRTWQRGLLPEPRRVRSVAAAPARGCPIAQKPRHREKSSAFRRPDSAGGSRDSQPRGREGLRGGPSPGRCRPWPPGGSRRRRRRWERGRAGARPERAALGSRPLSDTVVSFYLIVFNPSPSAGLITLCSVSQHLKVGLKLRTSSGNWSFMEGFGQLCL